MLFNLHYFPFSTAVRLPFFIYRHSDLFKLKGRIVLEAPVRTGMVEFGPHGLGTQDVLYSRSMLELLGTLVIKGKVSIGQGSKISVAEGATLTLGEDFRITGNSEIVCHKAITFGSDCLMSWDILLMDTDFHYVLDANGEQLNAPKPITIGNHVWIGCRNVILKGVSIADNTIISANSTITRSVMEKNCVIAGHGKSMEILRRNVTWRF